MARKKVLEHFEIPISANPKAFLSGVAKVESRAKKMHTALKKSLLLRFSLLPLVNLINVQRKAIDQQAKFADVMGLTTQQFAGLQVGAAITGVSINQVNTALTRMMKNIADASYGLENPTRALKELGLEANELMSVDTDTKLKMIADAFGKMENEAYKASVMINIFGRAGIQFSKLLETGSDGLERFTKEAVDMGFALNRVDAAKVEAANDAIARASFGIKTIGRVLAVELAPIIEFAANKFVAFSKQAGGFDDVIRNMRLPHILAGWLDHFTNLELKAAKTSLRMKKLAGVMATGGGRTMLFSPGNQVNAKKLNKEIDDLIKKITFLEARAGENSFSNALDRATESAAKFADKQKGLNNQVTQGKRRYDEYLADRVELSNKMLDGLNQEIAVFGDVGGALKRRYELEKSLLGEAAQAQKIKTMEDIKNARVRQLIKERDLEIDTPPQTISEVITRAPQLSRHEAIKNKYHFRMLKLNQNFEEQKIEIIKQGGAANAQIESLQFELREKAIAASFEKIAAEYKLSMQTLAQSTTEAVDPVAKFARLEKELADAVRLGGLSVENQALQLAEYRLEMNELIPGIQTMAELNGFLNNSYSSQEQQLKKLGDRIAVLKETALKFPDAAVAINAAIGSITKQQSDMLKGTSSDLESISKRAAENMQDAFADFLFDPFKDGIDGMLKSFISAIQRMIAEQAALNIFKSLSTSDGSFSTGSVVSGVKSWFGFDGGGYTGSGPRSGGLDNKGGFLTMMHPQESVFDHTKPAGGKNGGLLGGSGGSGGTTIVVEGATYQVQMIDTTGAAEFFEKHSEISLAHTRKALAESGVTL